MPDNLTPEQRHKNMSRIRSKNTKPEKKLGSMMHRAGLRYRKHADDLPGKPDFVFRGFKVAVFVDGDFWHGWKLREWEHKLTKDYWREKIRRNIARDRISREKLRAQGWKVIRIWEHQMKQCPELMLARVQRSVKKRRAQFRMNKKPAQPCAGNRDSGR